MRVVGPKSDLSEGVVHSECRKHFDDENVDAKIIYEFLLQHHEELSLDDFCGLYILIGIVI